jgi:putative DNA primase/helicase
MTDTALQELDTLVVKNSTAEPNSQPTQETDDEAVARLAALSPLHYDRIRKDEAKRLGVRSDILDKMVKAERDGEDVEQTPFDEVEPWPEPISPADLLADIATTIQRFIICDQETAHAAALWAAMTWFIDAVDVAPLAVITAPEKRCGKSQLLFLLGRIVNKPLAASNITPAALFRAIDAWTPTMLIDEADAFARDNEELRGLLNCGHTRESAFVVRVVGDDHTPKRFNVWGAKALAGIGHLADTIMDRSIILELKPKLSHERVDRLRHADKGMFLDIQSKLARFADDYSDQVRRCRPSLPDELNDRAQDNWEPLLAIADVAGGAWPEIARRSAIKISGSVSQSMTVGTELLSDIQEVLNSKGGDRISTKGLIEALCEDDEKPWSTYNRGKQLSPRQLSKRLNEYGIQSSTIRIGYGTAKGYMKEQFDEVFNRYLPDTTVTSVTT